MDKNTKDKIARLKRQNAALRELCDEVGDVVATYIKDKEELKRFDAWLDKEFKKIGEHYV